MTEKNSSIVQRIKHFTPQPIDIFIGARIRERRQKLDWTLSDLAEKLEVSHQQVQKYEQGLTRVSAGLMFQIASIFAVSINYFYEGYEETSKNPLLIEDMICFKRESPLHILLVEDDPADELLVREALEAAEKPLDLYTLHDSEQVLDFLRDKSGTNRFSRPDLILLDFTLPKMDGLHILREIKRDRYLQDIPVIILSNSISRKDLIDCYKNHASGYLGKSCDLDKFRDHIKIAIDYWSTICLPSM